MPREPGKYLHDIARAAASVQEFVAGRSLESWRDDLLLQSAVERQFEIMGEALNQLSRHAPEVAERIPEYKRIIAFRNILIHGYADVDSDLVWGVIERKLPALQQSVAKLLDEYQQP